MNTKKRKMLQIVSEVLKSSVYIFIIVMLIGAIGTIVVLEFVPQETIGKLVYVSFFPLSLGMLGTLVSWSFFTLLQDFIKGN